MFGSQAVRIVCTCVLALAGFLAAASPARAGLFGRQETPYTDLRPFPKWTGMLERYFEEKGSTAGPCESKRFNRCHYETWNRLIDSWRPLAKDRQLDEVNRYFNKSPYILDAINWGVSDYWETPGQFLAKSGDCEDYAIAKYLTLVRLGWPDAALHLVIVQDLNLRINHAILAADDRGQIRILDNQIAVVIDSKRIRHYRPVYSVNQEGWLRYH